MTAAFRTYHQPAIAAAGAAASTGLRQSRSPNAATIMSAASRPITGSVVSLVTAATPAATPKAIAQPRRRRRNQATANANATAHAASARASLLTAALTTRNLGHTASVVATATAMDSDSVSIPTAAKVATTATSPHSTETSRMVCSQSASCLCCAV